MVLFERGQAILFVTLFLTGWAGWENTSPAAEPSEVPFRAGAYAADITPTRFPISLNGQMHDRASKAAFDRLHALPGARRRQSPGGDRGRR